jgi:hypothetical protein
MPHSNYDIQVSDRDKWTVCLITLPISNDEMNSNYDCRQKEHTAKCNKRMSSNLNNWR